MKKQNLAPIELSENHRRSISITLQLVDKALCEWDDWVNGRMRCGVMYREQDTFSPTQKDRLRDKIVAIRDLLVRLRDDLQLEPKVAPTSQAIVGHASVLWEMLAELNSRALQAYGKVPDNLDHYLDPIGEQLAAEMNEIARLFSKSITGAITS
jgi:hypothetical protein